MTTYNRNEIKSIPVKRVSTGYKELDWLYGNTQNNWGMPMRTISLWAGESGTGKSRTAVSICNKLASNGYRILYFQNESDLGSFSKKIEYDSFRLSDSKHLGEMIKDIKQDRPHIVVVDSVNMIKEFKSGTASIIESIISEFQDICGTIGSHIILLGQLNQDGSIKGSTALPHLVDIALNIRKSTTDGLFVIEVGIKHRFGRTGKEFKSVWEHTDNGVKCISNSRELDSRWKSTTGIRPNIKRVAPKRRFSFFGK